MVTSFGLGRPSSGQNIYKNLNARVYNVLFVCTSYILLKLVSPILILIF